MTVCTSSNNFFRDNRRVFAFKHFASIAKMSIIKRISQQFRYLVLSWGWPLVFIPFEVRSRQYPANGFRLLHIIQMLQ